LQEKRTCAVSVLQLSKEGAGPVNPVLNTEVRVSRCGDNAPRRGRTTAQLNPQAEREIFHLLLRKRRCDRSLSRGKPGNLVEEHTPYSHLRPKKMQDSQPLNIRSRVWECTPKVRQATKGPATLNRGEQCWCPDKARQEYSP
jgi:hypothetical protein